MEYGSPLRKTIRVIEDGSEHKNIRDEHNVLYNGDARKEGDKISLEVTYCNELPSKLICGPCSYELHCNFSQKER